jgi:hypothetical protein
MKIKNLNILFFIVCLLQTGCYSFRGVSINKEIKSFSVALFTTTATAAPPTLAQTFTEKLKDKIRNNTSLSLVNTDVADIQISGQVVGYDVSAISPQPNQPAPYNQLRITIAIDWLNNKDKDEKKTWKQNFSFQGDFPGTGQLINFQDQLIKQITDKILEDIFNKAFTEDW